MRHAGDAFHLAGEPAQGVELMGEATDDGAAAQRVAAANPMAGRQRDILIVLEFPVVNLPQDAGIEDALEGHPIRVVAAVMGDGKGYPRLLARLDHPVAFIDVARHHFLDEHMLAGTRRVDGHRHMEIVRQQNLHRIDIRAREQFPVVPHNRHLRPQFPAHHLRMGGMRFGHRHHRTLVRALPEARHVLRKNAACTDDTDMKFVLHCCFLPLIQDSGFRMAAKWLTYTREFSARLPRAISRPSSSAATGPHPSPPPLRQGREILFPFLLLLPAPAQIRSKSRRKMKEQECYSPSLAAAGEGWGGGRWQQGGVESS